MLCFSQLYSRYVEKRTLNLYSSTLQKVPTPQYVVFYNGLKNEPDRKIIKLSDAFQTNGGCLECEVIMLNINYGQNHELMEKCRRLEEYAIFVDTVRKYAADEEITLTEAITLAIDVCVGKGILLDILIEQRAEVYMYVLEAFDKELYERDLKAEAIAAGLAEGLAEGRAEGARLKLKELVQRKLAKGQTPEIIADALEENVETIRELINELEKEE